MLFLLQQECGVRCCKHNIEDHSPSPVTFSSRFAVLLFYISGIWYIDVLWTIVDINWVLMKHRRCLILSHCYICFMTWWDVSILLWITVWMYELTPHIVNVPPLSLIFKTYLIGKCRALFQAYTEPNTAFGPQPVYLLIRDIVSFLQGFSGFLIKHVFREANTLAVWVALFIINHSGNMSWFYIRNMSRLFRNILFFNFFDYLSQDRCRAVLLN